MFASAVKRKYFRRILAYLAVAVFCAIVFLVYDRFSHQVRSFYMTYLFLPPLALGCGGNLLSVLFCGKAFSRAADNLFNSGVALITIGFLIRGILEIAGADSAYLPVFFAGGALLAVFGAVAAIVKNGEVTKDETVACGR